MASPIDPPRTPLAPVMRVLAEAALQRQNALLGADGKGAPSPVPFPEVPPPPGVVVALPAAVLRPPLPVAADRVSLSEQGREGLRGDRAAGSSGGSTARDGAAPSLRLPDASRGMAAAAAAVSGPAAAAWPASGVGGPLRHLLAALVQQLTQTGPAQRVVAAQPWSTGMQGVIDGTDPDHALGPLQTWLVGNGSAQTAEGERGLSLALWVPTAWAKSLPAAAAAPTANPAGTLAAPFAGRPQALASGVFALVLQPLDPAGARTSALLALEVAPWAGAATATVYGRDLMQARNDPWLHMAIQQASGQWREEEEAALRRGGSEPCHTVGCPYAGRAPCEQPFCMALRTMPLQPMSAT